MSTLKNTFKMLGSVIVYKLVTISRKVYDMLTPTKCSTATLTTKPGSRPNVNVNAEPFLLINDFNGYLDAP